MKAASPIMHFFHVCTSHVEIGLHNLICRCVFFLLFNSWLDGIVWQWARVRLVDE
jgi:hypothetical protein